MFNVLKITSGDREYNIVPRDDTLHQAFFGLQSVTSKTVPNEYNRYVSTLLYKNYAKFNTCNIGIADDADAFIDKDVPYIILCIQVKYHYSDKAFTCNHYIRLDYTEETSIGTGYFGMCRYCEMFPYSSSPIGDFKLSDSLIQIKVTFNSSSNLYLEIYSGLSDNSDMTNFTIDGVVALYIPNLSVQKS